MQKLVNYFNAPATLDLGVRYVCQKILIKRVQFDGVMVAMIHDYAGFANWQSRQGEAERLLLLIRRLLLPASTFISAGGRYCHG